MDRRLLAAGLAALFLLATAAAQANPSQLSIMQDDDALVYGGDAKRDVILGGDGDDQLLPGTGQDLVRAGFGNDVISARDGSRDVIECGPGNDAVTADRRDRLRGCERVSRR